jgi:AraC-like DNA-binding protein
MSMARDGVAEPVIRPVHLDTRIASGPDQFGVWRDMLSEVIDIELAERGAPDFPAERFDWQLNDIQVSKYVLTGAPERVWRHRPRSSRDHWCIVLARSAEGTTTGASRHLGIRLLSRPFEGRGSDDEVLTLFVPRDHLMISDAVLDELHQAQLQPALATLLTDYLTSLERVLPTLTRAQVTPLAEATKALLAACIAPTVERLARADGPVGAVLLERARQIVHQNIGNVDFGPNRLGRLLAVSRSKLYRLFEPHGGVARFIQRERLIEARRRLEDPLCTASVHVVGIDVGFLDHSTFSRAFRREFGLSPRDVRDRLVGGWSPPVGAGLSRPAQTSGR